VKWIIYIAFFTTVQLSAQSNVKPFIQLSYYQEYLSNVIFEDLEFGVGVQFNDYFSGQINLRGTQKAFYLNESGNVRFASMSIEPSYRILGKKHMLSPVIAYDAGIEIANNGRGKYIYLSNYVFFPNYDIAYHQFNKGLYYGKAKLLLSIQLKDFDILVGATYNTYVFQFYHLKPNGPQSYPPSPENKSKATYKFPDTQFGFGFEASLKYTFPMKKRSHDKLENR